MSDLVFLQPGWLWALLALPLLALWPRRPGRRVILVLRLIVLAFLILALARPGAVREDSPRHVVLLDGTAIDAASLPAVRSFAARLAGSHRVSWIEVGASETVESESLMRDALDERIDLVRIRDGGSPLGLALDEAALVLDRSCAGAITLVSDGRATERDRGLAVRDLCERGIPVHVVETARAEGDLYPLRVRPEGRLRVGRSGRLLVDVVGDGIVDVELFTDDSSQGEVTGLEVDGRATAALVFEPERSGFLHAEVRLRVVSGANARAMNDRLEGPIAVDEPLRALYLGERVTGGAARLATLVGRGLAIESLSPIATRLPDLRDYDIVIVDDRPAASIPETLQREIAAAVQNDELGLFVAGGSGSFGPGGYHQTPIGGLLPVEMVQKEEKRDPSTTLVVIIDTSGSMSGERVQIAKEVARLAIRRLLPHDKVGIVEFYGTKQWAAPIQSAANAIDIQRAINRLDAGGGTVILPAIEEAFYALQNVETRYKHVIVLTDGGVETGDFESILRKMAARGMNVSTVLVGGDTHSEFLVNLANWGKGHFYNASNRFQLPEILLKQPSTSKIPAYRPGGFALRGHGGPGWWGSVDPGSVPEIRAYVETRLRPGAQVLLETEPNRHPFVATWRHGLGRVTAFLTEPTGGGTEPWREWSEYGNWLLRVLSRTARERGDAFQFTASRFGRELVVEARRLVDGDLLPTAVITSLVEETDADRPLEFERRAPDLFVASALVDPTAPVALIGGDAAGRSRVHMISDPARCEESRFDPDFQLDLEELARVTGGSRSTLEALATFEPRSGPGRSLGFLRLWPFCLALALAVYALELAVRRSPLFEEEIH